MATDPDPGPLDDLVEHMVTNQIEPQLLAERLRTKGHRVETAFVDIGDEAPADWEEISCARCGRTARVLPGVVAQGRVAVCPPCLREIR